MNIGTAIRSPLVIAALGVATVAGGVTAGVMLTSGSSPAASCVFQSGATAAFCDTLGNPVTPANARTGQLDPVVWGVSRQSAYTNVGSDAAWPAATLTDPCGTQTVSPPNDVQMCNGQLYEAVNDGGTVPGHGGGNQTVLAMYPRQPFDIAGRTGAVVFDVSDDSQGIHGAWPEFAYTDQPIPAPYPGDGSLPSINLNPRNGLFVEFAATTTPNMNNSSTCVGVDHMTTVSNYSATGYIQMNNDGCVKPSTAAGQNNHVEIDISASSVKVYMTDAGTTSPLHLVADSSAAVPLTRGVVWMEDAHYNACKFGTQCIHTFSWANFGFDGPVLPRDLGYEVPDASPTSLSYHLPQTFNVPLSGVENATGALLEFTLGSNWSSDTITYTVNGHVNTAPYPAYVNFSATGALSIPVSQLVDGTNTVSIADSANLRMAEVDVILQGAGAGPPPTTTTVPTTVPPTTTTIPPTTTTTTTTTVPPTTTTTSTTVPPTTSTTVPPTTTTQAPVQITNLPCTVTFAAGPQTGTCTGTFMPG